MACLIIKKRTKIFRIIKKKDSTGFFHFVPRDEQEQAKDDFTTRKGRP
jgi:hypothetical protein